MCMGHRIPSLETILTPSETLSMTLSGLEVATNLNKDLYMDRQLFFSEQWL